MITAYIVDSWDDEYFIVSADGEQIIKEKYV